MIAFRPHRTPTAARGRRTGFSFIEVLFAVMILGIGFILIAGVFPVALSQTATTREETTAASMVRGASSAVSSITGTLSTGVIPADGAVHRLVDDQFKAIKGNQILPDDPRFAWIPLIKRDMQDSRGAVPTVAQLTVVAVQVRGRSAFDGSTTAGNEHDLQQNGTADSATGNLMAWPVQATFTEGGDGPDTVVLTASGGPLAGAGLGAAAQGAVLVVAKQGVVDGNGRPVTGRSYRLGNGSGTNWELLPGNDIAGASDAPPNTAVECWLVGQGLTNPGTGAANQFSGGSMVVGTYVTYIPLH